MSTAEPRTLPGPEDALARALENGLRRDFPERDATAKAMAELLLDAAESALPLADGGPAGPALEALELSAIDLDLFAWDGPPGWDVVLERGLGKRARVEPGQSVLDGLGDAKDREAQLHGLHERARGQARKLVELGRRAAKLTHHEPQAASALIEVHACLLRLVGLAAMAAPLQRAEDPAAGALTPPAEDALVREIDDRKAVGSDFAGAQEEWLARLQQHNPAAAAPSFRMFFAGLGQSLRVAVALRAFRDAARAGKAAADPEAILGAVGSWQPVRWMALRSGAPAVWYAELFPPAPAAEAPSARLVRECSAGLDAIGRLWTARDLSLTGFTTLASAATARCASALALWEELTTG